MIILDAISISKSVTPEGMVISKKYFTVIRNIYLPSWLMKFMVHESL